MSKSDTKGVPRPLKATPKDVDQASDKSGVRICCTGLLKGLETCIMGKHVSLFTFSVIFNLI